MTHILVWRACEKIRTVIGDEAVERLNFSGDLWEMLDALEVIQLKVQDSENFIFTPSEVLSLCNIRCGAYRIMDMVDELQDRMTPAAATMRRMLPRLAIKKYDIATKVNEMKNKVIELKSYCNNSIAEERASIMKLYGRLMDRRVTVPSFEEGSVFGRGTDKQRIVAMLQSAATNMAQGHPNCTILPIFGLPGSGKTTLAQMVFNEDAHSLQYYNFRLWVHVSWEFDFHRIGQSIIGQVVSGGGRGGGEKEELDYHSKLDLEEIKSDVLKRVHKLLKGKKVLLVLDDLWEESSFRLHVLKSMLTSLSDKVDVIVTTSNQAIAKKICTVQPYRLNPLSDDTCWEIIKKRIDVGEDEELEKIGRKIASKCRGVPLAAVEYASVQVTSLYPKLMRSVPLRDLTDWEKDVERNFGTRSGALLSTFFLSYTSMPPELKLCLDYCCGIFPNGHHMVKDDLIHQWIAHDFIEASQRSSAIEIAEGYITRLLDMSFFQIAKSYHTSGNYHKGAAIFTMHNMVHDYLSCKLDPSFCPYMLVTNCRGKLDYHLDGLRALHCINCCNLVFNDGSFLSQRSLRVLELKESPAPKLPGSICKLRHLGYLKITEFFGLVTLPEAFGDLINLFHIDLSSCSALATLPESFGKLFCLVHINLSGCSRLATLPESFGDLLNLSHLNLSGCHGLEEIPDRLQKLGKLIHLDLSFWSCFQGIGKGLGSLTNLEHLNLSNPCCHLAQQRSHLQEIKDGLCKLTSLKYLNLSMCLNPIFYYHKSQEESLQYIQSCVRCLLSLEHLDLSHNTFLVDLPQCLGYTNRLHTLDLSGCIRLKKVGAMKSLKFITLKNCRALESCNFVACVPEDDVVYSSSNLVQLEDVDCQELQISGLEKVRSKDEAQRIKLVEKQKLEKLKLSWTLDCIRSVEDSALLGELTPPANLQCLEVNGYNGTCLPEFLGNLTSLHELKIICCKQLICLPDSIQKLTNLKDLCIFGCPELEKWCQLEGNKKMLAHIPNKTNEEHASTSRPRSRRMADQSMMWRQQ